MLRIDFAISVSRSHIKNDLPQMCIITYKQSTLDCELNKKKKIQEMSKSMSVGRDLFGVIDSLELLRNNRNNNKYGNNSAF